ncbi:MAG: hypothetical protein MI673_05830 [Thiotrichales bacterium]|nr:hypothetical protein [Thiotrichales bacterium]
MNSSTDNLAKAIRQQAEPAEDRIITEKSGEYRNRLRVLHNRITAARDGEALEQSDLQHSGQQHS